MAETSVLLSPELEKLYPQMLATPIRTKKRTLTSGTCMIDGGHFSTCLALQEQPLTVTLNIEGDNVLTVQDLTPRPKITCATCPITRNPQNI